MTAQSPGSYVLSALAHGAVVALVVLLSLEVRQSVDEAPKVIELVAGEGSNYAATEAPALGIPNGLKITTADEAPPTPEPASPAPLIEAPPVVQPAPLPEAPSDNVVEPAPEPAPKPARLAPAAPSKTASSSVPDLKKQLLRREKRKEAALEQRYRKQQEALERKQAAAAKAALAHHARIDAEGILAGVVGGSADNTVGGAGGKALQREQADEMALYKQFLDEQFAKNMAFTDPDRGNYKTGLTFFLAADGSISRVSVTQPSGSPAFDQAVIEAVSRTRSIGPRPDAQGGTIRTVFDGRVDADAAGGAP